MDIDTPGSLLIKPIAPLIAFGMRLRAPSIIPRTELIASLNAEPIALATVLPTVENVFVIVDIIPPKNSPTFEKTFLIPSQAFLNILQKEFYR